MKTRSKGGKRRSKGTKKNKKIVHKHKHKHEHEHEHEHNKKNVNCSPNPNNMNDFTCYSNNALLKMKKYWNIRHSSNKINSNDTKQIWEQLKKNLSHICHKESCWIRSKFMKGNLDNELINYTFAPKSPEEWKKNPTDWLSSMDIESVMKQYEKFYKCFEFFGPSPIDFDDHKLYGECVWEELCKFSLANEIKNGKNKIGIIFNTHPHYKEGEHWVALFMNIKKKYIIYFDSNGDEVPKQIEHLMQRIQKQGNQLGIHFDKLYNKVNHQQSDSECGMYCLYFIIEMLKDKNIQYFLNNKIPDKEVFKLRKKYFN